MEFEAVPAASVVATGGRVLHNSLMRRSSKSWQVGMMVSMEGDQTTNTRSSRCRDKEFGKRCGTMRRRDTDDECGELLPISGGEVHHGVEDLDTCVGIDIDAALVWCARGRRMRGQ
jgi:hypothetical protein